VYDLALKMPLLFHNPIWKYLIERKAGDILFTYKGKNYTAGWLKSKSLQLAVSLANSGVKREDIIVLAIPPGPEFMMVFFACSLLRVRIALVDPHMGIAHYEAMVLQLSPNWVFIDSRLVLMQEHPFLRKLYFRLNKKPVYFPKIKDCRKIVCGLPLPLISSHLKLKNLMKTAINEVLPEEDPGDEEFLIVYTSGTLAQPKGVVHSFGTLSTSIQILLDTFPDLKGKAIATHLPHFVLLGIRAGMKVHIWEEAWSSVRRWDYIYDNQIQVLFGPPAEWIPLINYCKSKDKKLPESLEYLLLGSAPVYPSFIQKILEYTARPLKITGIYGMTEHLLIAHANGDAILKYGGQGTFVGKLFDGVNIHLDDSGEIELQSRQLSKDI
jgi:acyl-coenzyme A synthetase/AMP-(fatty) acid ligase